ncbi:NADH:ubiquinone reductase (Na(+)-transporting) subunit C [Cyclobacterium jeungdonense]|uniref:Na(+)-translocating NADH-quinone reductase subunit C n=1 Tax=Cyclobacterium jeungdonense TaxID=708087 RepID=A0ABT8C885_9BACT|nr:NADH:ubiquinone reductase (Na(+)-transporting) subunit C [Cyclobacterium jeungdonense]MDN3687838.1 NADH:ubiquinone reductase (Na(+)-transporting) subunit C [Cyclobacterium jeungdonense]
MQQSNAYIITFSIILTVVLGLLLSGTAEVLKPIQKKAEELDTKKQILGAVMPAEKIDAMKPDEINSFYQSRISSKVVNIDGEEVEEQDGAQVTAETIDVGKNYKKDPEDRLYPVFIFHEEGNVDAVASYIFPVYGNGLWDNIWGYLALQTNMETIEGITFSHAGETPGLGARITSTDVQERYKEKSIFNESGELVSVVMQKGEGKDYSGEPHKVDGLSGATITAEGVNKMLKSYLEHYKAYIEKNKEGASGMALN